MNPTIDACQDFFGYACNGFVKSAVIPSDRQPGGHQEVDRRNEDFFHDVLEKAADNPGDDPVLRKIGDYYAACKDEDTIEKAGLTPIQPLLAIASGVKDPATLASAVVALHAAGIFPLFEVLSEQDFKDATQVIADLNQGGIGLPDRNYYLKDEGNLRAVRDFYAGHVGRMFSLLGLLPPRPSSPSPT